MWKQTGAHTNALLENTKDDRVIEIQVRKEQNKKFLAESHGR